eukprot:3468763-Rhodomonas_salina.1
MDAMHPFMEAILIDGTVLLSVTAVFLVMDTVRLIMADTLLYMDAPLPIMAATLLFMTSEPHPPTSAALACLGPICQSIIADVASPSGTNLPDFVAICSTELGYGATSARHVVRAHRLQYQDRQVLLPPYAPPTPCPVLHTVLCCYSPTPLLLLRYVSPYAPPPTTLCIPLRPSYAISGTRIASCAATLLRPSPVFSLMTLLRTVPPYAPPPTPCPCVVLSAGAICGTGLAYAASSAALQYRSAILDQHACYAKPAISLRACYAKPGTDLVHGPTTTDVKPGTDLRACYAKSGTDVACGTAFCTRAGVWRSCA